MIRKAKSPGSGETRDAYAHLCAAYWSPLYSFVRRRGYDAEHARDLTQEFFATLIERKALEGVGPEKGRFRSFLLKSLSNLLADEWAKETAKKRIPKSELVRIDADEAERIYARTPVNGLSPEEHFDREWAMTILRNAFNGLHDEHRRNGKSEQFEALSPYLTTGADHVPYAELSERMGKNANAVKVAVHRLRTRYRDAIREQIADTVLTEEAFEEELEYMFRVVGTIQA